MFFIHMLAEKVPGADAFQFQELDCKRQALFYTVR